MLFRALGYAVAALAVGIPEAVAEGLESGTDQCTYGGTRAFMISQGTGDLIGETRYVRALKTDTLHDIACRNNIGIEEIFMANDPAKIDHWAPGEGTKVLVPQRFILPDAPRAGVVVNVPEMRLYYYPVKYAPAARKSQSNSKSGAKGKKTVAKRSEPPAGVGEPISKATEVMTFPISMGRMDWRTPLGKTRIAAKVKDPTWTPPESIRREHAAKGDMLPAVVPAGPDNPLGSYAMRLGIPGYLIHGTEQNYKSFGIGMRVTHGCMRMYNKDVERLFPMVSVGTPVYLVNQPIKLGWQQGRLFLETSQPLDEDAGIPPEKDEDSMTEAELAAEEAKTLEQRLAEKKRKNEKRSAYLMKVALKQIEKENAKRPILLDREALRKAIATPTGFPEEIGKEALPVEAAPMGSEKSPGDALLHGGGSPPAAVSGSGWTPDSGSGNSSVDPYFDEPPVTDAIHEVDTAGDSAEDRYGTEQQPVPVSSVPAAAGKQAGQEPAEIESDPYLSAPDASVQPVPDQALPDPYAPDRSTSSGDVMSQDQSEEGGR